MSGTQKAVGKAVENVMREQAVRCVGNLGVWMTVGQVAEACEMSKPTARKYMNILVGAGMATKSEKQREMDTVYYRFLIEAE
jgi:DNA-binding transcriptional ArsR family regulator